jgi:hypothetical protein
LTVSEGLSSELGATGGATVVSGVKSIGTELLGIGADSIGAE